MRHNKQAVYLHLIWSTWDRLPLIDATIERRLYRQLESESVRKGCKVLALNGVADHVHLVVELSPTVSISQLVRQLKGGSSHFVNETLRPETLFKWQASYSVFSISRWDLEKVTNYIKRQKEHHATGKLAMSQEVAED